MCLNERLFFPVYIQVVIQFKEKSIGSLWVAYMDSLEKKVNHSILKTCLYLTLRMAQGTH